jgi:WD40 repeat protein
MARWVRPWLFFVAVVAAGCGSADRNPPSGSAGMPATDGDAGAPGMAVMHVDPAVSAQYRWSECDRIEPSAPAVNALYATDESVLTLEASGRIRLFPSGSPVGATLVPARDPMLSIASAIQLSPDGRWLLSPSTARGVDIYAQADHTPIVAGAGALELVANLDPAAQCGTDAGFSSDSELVVTGGDGVVCAFESATGTLRAKVAVPKAVGMTALTLLVGAPSRIAIWRDSQLLHYSLAGELQAQFDAVATSTGQEKVWSAQFTPDARCLLVAYSPNFEDYSVPPELVAVETETGAELWRATLERSEPSPIISSDGTVVLVQHGPAFRISDGMVVGSDPDGSFQRSMVLGPGGRRALRLGELFSEWEVSTHQLLRLYGSHTEGIRDLDISRDGRYLASHGRRAVVWQLADDFAGSAPLFDGAAPDDSWNVALAADGQVLTVSGDNVAIFRRDGSSWVAPPPPASADIACLSADWSFSPLGTWTAGTNYRDQVELLDTTDLQPRMALPTSNCGGGVAFSPDGSKLVTASLELFDTQSWTRLANAPAADVHDVLGSYGEDAVQFSPDASEVAVTRCARNTELVCRTQRHAAADGHLLGDATGLLGQRARYSPEGHWLVSDNHLLHLPTGLLLELAPAAAEALFTPDGDVIAGEADGALVRYCRSPE